MADIKAFLLPPVMDETKEVVITKRAVDENGKPVPFVIRVIDQATNNPVIEAGYEEKSLQWPCGSGTGYGTVWKASGRGLCGAANFKNAELCAYYKTVDPLEVPGRMLTMGEYNLLVRKIRELNDIVDNDEDLEDIEEEAKN